MKALIIIFIIIVLLIALFCVAMMVRDLVINEMERKEQKN